MTASCTDLRAVFWSSWNVYQRCIAGRGSVGLTRGRRKPGLDWVAPFSDYLVDFEHIARENLSPEQMAVLEGHFLRDIRFPDVLRWLMARRFDFNRGSFWHMVYRMERRLALALISGGLYPPEKYFETWQFIKRGQLGHTIEKPRVIDYDRQMKSEPITPRCLRGGPRHQTGKWWEHNAPQVE